MKGMKVTHKKSFLIFRKFCVLEICYIRLDFYEFNLEGPGTSGDCDTNENMKVTGHVSLSSLKCFQVHTYSLS